MTEIVQDDNPCNPVGLIAKRCRVQYHPAVEAHNNNTHVGMYIMHSLPRSLLRPAPFPIGSRAALESTVAKVKASRMSQDAIAKWEAFALAAPATDSVDEYCATSPLYVPLKNELFRGLVAIDEPSAAAPIARRNVPRSSESGFSASTLHRDTARCLDCVVWPNRNQPISYIPPRIVLSSATDTTSDAIARAALIPNQNYSELIVPQLKYMCSVRGLHLPTSAKKQVLVTALQQYDQGGSAVALPGQQFLSMTRTELLHYISVNQPDRVVNRTSSKPQLVDICRSIGV